MHITKSGPDDAYDNAHFLCHNPHHIHRRHPHRNNLLQFLMPTIQNNNNNNNKTKRHPRQKKLIRNIIFSHIGFPVEPISYDFLII